MLRLAVIAVLTGCCLLTGSCASVPPDAAPHEYLDERTGATVTMVDRPLIFARDRSERAANLRDYVTLVATSVDRSGQYDFVWVAYVWSTLDALADATTSAAEVVVTADDRRISLQPVAANAVEAGISVPIRAPPHVAAISHIFASDLATMRFIAAARSVRVQVSADPAATYYDLWDDRRDSLRDFVRHAAGER